MPTPPDKLSICFVAFNAYGRLCGSNLRHAGGIEVQQVLMARWLSQRGHRVSMITWDEGQADGQIIDGVRNLKTCRPEAGLKGLRFFHPRWTQLNRVLAQSDADLYYYNCGDLGLGQIVMWARRKNKKVVYAVPSDPDCDPSLPKLKPWRERALYRFGLRRADRVIVQTRTQQRLLANGFGLQAAVLPMPCAGFPPSNGGMGCFPDKKRVLWVGRFSKEKRLEWLLDIAEQCPDLEFVVIGSPNQESSYSENLLSRAERVANVRLIGRIDHEQMGAHYRNAALLCCTSSYEGFPNTFLESWSTGLPVVTTFDPDGVVQQHGTGLVAHHRTDLLAGIRALINDPFARSRMSDAARSYFRKHHTLGATLPKFENLFLELRAR